jgi:hypothetical protein
MARRKGLTGRFSTNSIQAASAGRTNAMSVTGRMAGPLNRRTGNRLAGGATQTLGNGRGGAMVSRRKRYYDVRKGLSLSGG